MPVTIVIGLLLVPLHLVIQFFHEFASDLILVTCNATCGPAESRMHVVLVLAGLKKRLLLRCQLGVSPWLQVYCSRTHAHAFRARHGITARWTNTALLRFSLLLPNLATVRNAVRLLLNSLSAQALRPCLGRLVLVLQTPSHHFEKVVALVANLITQISLCLLDELSNCWFLVDSVLIDNRAKWVISVLIHRFERVLLSSIKTVLHLLLLQCIIPISLP